jgi:succinate dehydrogenase hydrophobic anchor subunit
VKWLESVESIDDSEDQLTKIRKIMEAIFHSLGNFNLVPKELLNSPGSLNGTSLYLSNKHTTYRQLEPFVHPTASDAIFRLLNIVQDGSHAEGGLKLNIDDYIHKHQSDYLFKSCIYLLFEIIVWYKRLIQEFSDPEVNMSLWTAPDTALLGKGTLKQDSLGNFYCNGLLVTYTEFRDRGYSLGDELEVLEIRENGNAKSKVYYPKCAFKTRKL